VKVAAAQIACAPGELKTNLRIIRDCATSARARGADLVVFPEMSDTGYSMPMIREHATRWEDGAVASLQRFAQTLSIAIVCGVSERDGDRIYNSQVFIDRNGGIIAKYRKTHLAAIGSLDERPVFTAGDKFVACEHDDFNFGLTICYDLRFPEVYRALAVEHGANVFVNSSAWPLVRAKHLRMLALARAVENQSYFILTNRVGTDDEGIFCGESAIIDPAGNVLAEASADHDELITADISKEVVDLTRKRMCAFEHRRRDLY
jgi:omega-amidase